MASNHIQTELQHMCSVSSVLVASTCLCGHNCSIVCHSAAHVHTSKVLFFKYMLWSEKLARIRTIALDIMHFPWKCNHSIVMWHKCKTLNHKTLQSLLNTRKMQLSTYFNQGVLATEPRVTVELIVAIKHQTTAEFSIIQQCIWK